MAVTSFISATSTSTSSGSSRNPCPRRKRERSTATGRFGGSALAAVAVATALLTSFSSLSVAGADDSTVSGGWRHSCVLLTDGSVKCFGLNGWGQIGTGDPARRGDGSSTSEPMGDDLPSVNLGTNETAIGVSAGLSHTCALLTSGRVKCWGRNNWGQLGQGDYVDRGETALSMGDALLPIDLGTTSDGVSPLLATGVAAGAEFTCVLLEDASVKCLGRNDEGQLGRGDTEDNVGSSAVDLGDALVAVDLGTNVTVAAISSGTAATCANLEGGGMKCWGSNAYGGLGVEDSLARGDEAKDMGDNLAEVDLGTGVEAETVFYGQRHVCAIVTGGRVKCWGDNRSGQLGIGHVDTIGDDAGEMGDGLPFVDLGVGAKASWLSLGESHSCAMLASGEIKCWGKGYSGQLGDGQYTARGKYPDEMSTGLVAVDLGTGTDAAVLGAGHDHTCAALDDGSLKCWGLNLLGSLGLGDSLPRGDEPGEMGDDLPAVSLGTGAKVALPTLPTPSPTLAPTPSPTLAPTLAPVLLTSAPTQVPSQASTIAPTVASSPAPTATREKTVPRTPSPTIAPTVAVTVADTAAGTAADTAAGTAADTAASGNARGVQVEAVEESNEQHFLERQTAIVTAIAAPLALLSLLACVCLCRKKRRSREKQSASTLARQSYKMDGGVTGLGGLGGHKASVSGNNSEVGGIPLGIRSSSIRSGSFGSQQNVRVQPSTSEESNSPTRPNHEDDVNHMVFAAEGSMAIADADGPFTHDMGAESNHASSVTDSTSGGSAGISSGPRASGSSPEAGGEGGLEEMGGGGGDAPSPFNNSENWRFENDDLAEQRNSSFRGRNSDLILQRSVSAGRPGVRR